ncbi:hypothetical protein NL676_034313 [Syzygium grande]|nr:hypothetical protein NL676_034313 [Syzygium grande]
MWGCFTIFITAISRLICSVIPTFTTFSFPTTFIATLRPLRSSRAWYTFANVPCPRSRPSSYFPCRIDELPSSPFFVILRGVYFPPGREKPEPKNRRREILRKKKQQRATRTENRKGSSSEAEPPDHPSSTCLRWQVRPPMRELARQHDSGLAVDEEGEGQWATIISMHSLDAKEKGFLPIFMTFQARISEKKKKGRRRERDE